MQKARVLFLILRFPGCADLRDMKRLFAFRAHGGIDVEYRCHAAVALPAFVAERETGIFMHELQMRKFFKEAAAVASI